MTAPAAPSAHRARGARIGRGMLLAVAAVAIVAQASLIALAGWALANPRLVADGWTVWTTEPDPVVAAHAREAGLGEQGRFLLYASLPQIVPADDFDVLCGGDEPGVGILGCYTTVDRRIYLYDITNPDLAPLEPVVTAHEMLHAAWDRLDDAERESLVAPLERAFAALGPDHELVERIATYEQLDPSSRIPELYAILGSEVPSLGTELESHYARYFDDRSRVVALYAEANAVFVALEQQLTALTAELDALNTRIEAEQAAYDIDSEALAADITAFNARAAEPGGYTSQSVFLRDRDVIIARQAALEERREATNALVDEYNALLDELETLNAEADELNRAINIELEPLPVEPDPVEQPSEG